MIPSLMRRIICAVHTLFVTVYAGSALAAQVEIDAPIVPQPGDEIAVRVRFDEPLDARSKPSADLIFPTGQPQGLREGRWDKDGALWSFAPVKLGPNKGLGQLVVRAAAATDGTDMVVHEEPFVVGTEPLVAQLKKFADWMVERPHDFIFVEGYFYRTYLGLYEITGEKKYLDLAIQGAEKLLKKQEPEGYWGTGYGGVFLADTGSALGLLTNLYKHTSPELQKRIDDALNRYVHLVLVQGDSKGRPFVHEDGSLGAGFKSMKDGKVVGDINKPYTIATSLTGAEVFAAMYYMHGKDSYKQIAMRACDWLLGTINKEGVFPYILEDWNPKGANREELWKSYRYNTAAYVGEGLMQAWTYIDDPAFRKNIEQGIKPNIDWLVRTQNADGSWDEKNTEIGLFDQARSHGVVNVLVWYYENVERDPKVSAAVRRYYRLMLDDKRPSYWHVASPTPVKSRYKVPLDYVSTSICGRAMVEIIKPGADCYRWKKQDVSSTTDSNKNQREKGPYRLKATIQSPERYKNVPYSIEVDFDKLLRDKNIKGTFDRHSVVVKKADAKTGDLHDVHYNLSSDFLMTNKGRVNWLIEDTNDREYVIFFDVKEHGPFSPPSYIGLVGNGDSLLYNDGKLHPLFVGMSANPVAVDWDGDGVTDILSTQNYGFTRGSPEHAVQFLKNEGTNERPVFGDGIHLRYEQGGKTHFLSAGLCIEAVDWNGDGRLDIVTNQYKGPAVAVFLNTGRKDKHGLPVLEYSQEIKTQAGEYGCFRLVDFHGDGRLDLVVSYLSGEPKLNIDDPLWFKATEEEKRKAHWPRWYYQYRFDYYENVAGPGKSPKFGPPDRLKTADGQEIRWHICPSFECMDWDGDGRNELLTLCNSELLDKGYAGVRIYKNVGTANKPVFEDRGLIAGLQDRSGMYFRKADTPAFKGLLVAPGSLGGRIRYYESQGRDAKGQIAIVDRGFLMQRNGYVNPCCGYAQAALADWENDGDWDLTLGCETGWVTRSRNIGSQQRPVYSEPEFLELDGKPIELLHGPFGDPAGIMECTIGQTAPAYLDWDGDGVMDLLVVMGQKFLFYKNAGTSIDPKLLKPVDVTTFDGHPVHGFRDKPAIVDWNRDGLLDVVGNTGDKTFLFKRYRDTKDGVLKLAAGELLKFTDGAALNLGGFCSAADWNGQGVYDLFSSAWNQMLYCKNAGTNAQPAFLKPTVMTADGQSLSVGSHVTTPIPIDWDHSGRLDILASGESGLLFLYRRNYLDGIHHKITCRVEAEQAETDQLRKNGGARSARPTLQLQAEDWAQRRRQIIAGAEEVIGSLPDVSKFPPLDIKVIEQVEFDDYVRISLTYQAEAGDRVPAYLLLPKKRREGRTPAIIALHSTSRYGKKLVCGEAVAGTPVRTENMVPTSDTVAAYPPEMVAANEYGKELARRGYIVLAPDFPAFGDYPYDFRKSKYTSGSMKGIVNHIRAVDLLLAREDVDPKRIGVIGHSLGGQNAMFLGAFDPRVKVVVASGGWAPFRFTRNFDKPGSWDQDVYMPRIRTVYAFDYNRVPFDLPDLAAALSPRAFFSSSPLRDEYCDVVGVKQAEPGLRKVYGLLDAADRVQLEYPSCVHDFPPECRRKAYAFLDRMLHHSPSKLVP
jgi:dienelactone hydrolase